MNNVCKACGRKFHSDLRFCPRCGGGARPTRAKDWHYRHSGALAHRDRTRTDELMVHRQNAGVLLSAFILLLPLWLMDLQNINVHIGQRELFDPDMLSFYLSTAVLVLLAAAMTSAWQGKRQGLQVIVPGILVIHTTMWDLEVMVVVLLVYFVVVVLWGIGAGRTARMDPSYLPVVSGIGILALVLTYMWVVASQ